MGLSMLGYFQENWLWHINLQAESLGKDSSGTEMRRGIYMFGSGYEWKNFILVGSIGLVDTMTIVKGQSSPTYIDPYTGVAYGPNGTKHNTKMGYMLLLSHRFYLSRISRNKKIGWSLSPRISYTDQFATSPYKGVLSYGLAVDFWMD
ncbi:MAG: hypothetical protein M9962_13195 [Oligoflexia bacterium]|nr:hypothetical protein [Oligoflexia bacterium]